MVSLLVLVVIATFASQPTPAIADPVPPTQWAPASLASMHEPQLALTHADGGVSIGCAGGSAYSDPNAAGLTSFSATGMVTQTVSYASGVEACAGGTAVAANGTVFAAGFTNNWSVYVVRAISGGQTLWTYSLPCGGSVAAMVVGTNGNVYMAVNGAGSPCSGSRRIIGVTPTAAQGQTSPTQVMNAGLASNVLHGGLAAYADGLVARSSQGVQYVGYDGTVEDEVVPGIGAHYDSFDAEVENGTVFVPIKAHSGLTINCQVPAEVVSSLRPTTAGGSSTDIALPACSRVFEIQPMPKGGVVLRASTHGTTDLQPAERLLAYSVGGTLLWEHALPTTTYPHSSSPYNANAFAVDMHGNVAVQNRLVVTKTIGGSSYKFPEVQFILLSGNTGSTIGGTFFALRGDQTSPSGPSYYEWIGERVNIANGVVYVAAEECSYFPGGCPGSNAKLYAFTVPGLGMDYPRGAVLNYNLPWKNYVALGDSYSSGEGVEPFLPGTDTAGPPENRCHRSELAYPKLLDGDPGARLNLTGFVACSGATTSSLAATGQFNEGPQIVALDSNVDIVTLTIGGNDIGFKEFATSCVTSNCGGWRKRRGAQKDT